MVWSSKATKFTKKTSQSDEVCLSPLSSSASIDSAEHTLEDLDLLYQRWYNEGYDIYDEKYMSWVRANQSLHSLLLLYQLAAAETNLVDLWNLHRVNVVAISVKYMHSLNQKLNKEKWRKL